jgi:arsenite/tail-anchored protein-transporting ATPase
MDAPSSSAPLHLPPRRLGPVVLVLGKGGVGRTTVAASLAVLEAQTHGAAVLVEFGDGASGRRALGSYHPHVEHVVIRPHEALQRAATPLFGSATVARLALGNFAIRRLVRAAPAVNELAMLESVRQVSVGHPGVLVVVDMPATGHSVALLRVPGQGREYLRSGPLWEYCDRLSRELVAPGRASIVVVTLPERLVLEETLELCAAIVSETGLEVDRLVVNRVPLPLSPAALDAARALATAPGPLAAPAAALAAVLEGRESACREAAAALSIIPHGRYPLWRLPLAPVDPSASDVARWLVAEGAG